MLLLFKKYRIMTDEELYIAILGKMNKDNFEFYLEELKEVKARMRRVSVEELEKEFEQKSEFLMYNSEFEFDEVGVEKFVDILFGRVLREGSDVVVPFEDIQSYEYRLWLEQKLKGKGRSKGGSSKIDYSGYRMWRYNPIIFYKDGRIARHRLLLNDDFDTMDFLNNRKFAIMSPVTYVGRTNSYRNARYLYAFVIDLDGVKCSDVHVLLRGMVNGWIPVANMIVNSGHGVHLYFILEQPIGMYETRALLLNRLKAGLTRLVWLVSRLDHPQIQSVVQGFRLPGTLTKFGRPIRAFWNRSAPLHTLEDLNKFISTDYKLSDIELAQLKEINPHNPSRVTLEEAKRLWPEWYAARVIGHSRVGRKWHLHRGLYDWWLNILKKGDAVTVHHRYWCILTLVVYAVKCGVPREEVLEDALALVRPFDLKTETVDNPFTKDDVLDAMRAYDEEYNKWPIKVIESTTGIRIERNRRNGRSRKKHIEVMNAIRDYATHPDGKWREGNGRKKATFDDSSFAKIVQEWQSQHPECKNKSRCARETGLSRPTVHRWWNSANEASVSPVE